LEESVYRLEDLAYHSAVFQSAVFQSAVYQSAVYRLGTASHG
jgi:hypothetical protein